MEKLYDRDYSQWAETMADLLESGNLTELDIENLVEEVRDLSKRERDRFIPISYSSNKTSFFHIKYWQVISEVWTAYI